MSDYFSQGEAYPDLGANHLVSVDARTTLALCLTSREFEVQELRRWVLDDVGICDVIVVDCVNDQVPTRNTVGVKVRERLALVFPHNTENPPQVRALRKDFPVVPHLNHTAADQPSWLCIYAEPWSAVQRTWTPQKNLQHIFEWLSKTARRILHRPDQPVERIYFDSTRDLILPPDFDAKLGRNDLVLMLQTIDRKDDHRSIRAEFVPAREVEQRELPFFVPLVLTLDSIVHGRVEQYPSDLGMLHDQLTSHGGSLLEPLQGAIRGLGRSVQPSKTQGCLLILHLSIRRAVGAPPERTETRGFGVLRDLATLGEVTGVLSKHQGYAVPLIGDSNPPESTEWRKVQITPLDVKHGLTKELARKSSGISDVTASERRVLAGLGALGSSMADIWSREAWGEWTFVDPDYVQPHNIARHVAKDFHIGWFKVNVVKQIVELNYHDGHVSSVSIPDGILNQGNPDIQESITSSSLLVDATTTLEVPRDLSQRDDVCRSVSAFLVPSGAASVLLMEDSKRDIRLDCLEAQYYFAVLNSGWGVRHLVGHNGQLWVGAGCRDVSRVISTEAVQLHAAVLARQIRLLSAQPEAAIRVWTSDEETSAVVVAMVDVGSVRIIDSGVDWKIVSHEGVEKKLIELRQKYLPSETGGVILGYTDHKLKTIFVVDVLPAPRDSNGDQTGFTRGIEGLEQQISTAKQRTANIVGYIGEWHSHPPFNSAAPSPDDRLLLEHLGAVLAGDGEPAVMIIVGRANELSFSVRA